MCVINYTHFNVLASFAMLYSHYQYSLHISDSLKPQSVTLFHAEAVNKPQTRKQPPLPPPPPNPHLHITFHYSVFILHSAAGSTTILHNEGLALPHTDCNNGEMVILRKNLTGSLYVMSYTTNTTTTGRLTA
jgi:hypothetical protein